MSDDLAKIAFVRELSSRAVRTIRQNIVVSLANVAFMVVMALLGYLGLVTGLLLNEASALFVIANALRLLKWRSTGMPVIAEKTATAQIGMQMNEQKAMVASPFATIEAGCCCGEPTLGVSIPTLVVNEAKDACCCASEEPSPKVSFPIFPMAAAQGSCCSGADVSSPVSGPD